MAAPWEFSLVALQAWGISRRDLVVSVPWDRSHSVSQAAWISLCSPRCLSSSSSPRARITGMSHRTSCTFSLGDMLTDLRALEHLEAHLLPVCSQ